MVSRWIEVAGGHPPAIKGNGGAVRLEIDRVIVAPSYGRVLRRFRKKFIVLFETISHEGRARASLRGP
jgi:hypothetical protein